MNQIKEIKEKMQKERDDYWKPIVADLKRECDVFKNEWTFKEKKWKAERNVLKLERDTFKALGCDVTFHAHYYTFLYLVWWPMCPDPRSL
ncbi:hypothetical protein TNCT_386861 [Trichonephila clavata]|uniref:Uncharacterized protein n=1 Tax=Trichonephila clavata TaxID=2740835 RepID=A0A8X6GX27_TRICU|nr:hypothetical protein TNCT_386861 [Trichonephila clavata]